MPKKSFEKIRGEEIAFLEKEMSRLRGNLQEADSAAAYQKYMSVYLRTQNQYLKLLQASGEAAASDPLLEFNKK